MKVYLYYYSYINYFYYEEAMRRRDADVVPAGKLENAIESPLENATENPR